MKYIINWYYRFILYIRYGSIDNFWLQTQHEQQVDKVKKTITER